MNWIPPEECPRKELHANHVYGDRYETRPSRDGGVWVYLDGKKAMHGWIQQICPGCQLYRIWSPRKPQGRSGRIE